MSKHPLILLIVVLSLFGIGTPSWGEPGDTHPLIAQEQRIEILISNSEFLVTQPAGLQIEAPVVIIVRNQDIVRHGFTSPMLLGQEVTAEGEGISAYGKGIEGFHIEAGKTLVIRFTPEHPGRFEFHCDIHAQMKGEILLLEVGTV